MCTSTHIQPDFSSQELVEDARADGARVVAGGERVRPPSAPQGFFYAPTILADLPDTARIVREEQFGPALPVLSYETVDEAVERANDSEYGLGASVWGANVAEAASVAARLQARRRARCGRGEGGGGG